VVVLSDALWRRLGAGDPTFVGRTINLEGVPYQVVGVAPPELRYPQGASYWVPLQRDRMPDPTLRGARFLSVVARMYSSADAGRVAAGLEREAVAWRDRYPFYPDGMRHALLAKPLAEVIAGDLRPVLWTLSAAVGLVLLIACLNVASLQLVLAVARTRDVGIRMALGASRIRVLGQVLIESVLVSALGGALGLCVAWLLATFFSARVPAGSPLVGATFFDGRVLAATIAVTAFCGVTIGLAAAARMFRTNMGEMLSATPRGASIGVERHRLLRWGMVTQVAVAVVLLTGAGLMLRTLHALVATNPGFRPENLATFGVALPRGTYTDSVRRLLFHDELLARLARVPEIERVASTSGLPLSGGSWWSTFTLDGREPGPGEPRQQAQIRIVSRDYFRTMGIPVRGGVDFTAAELHPHAPAVVVDESFARTFAQGANVVGRTLDQLGSATIVGVVGGVRANELAEPPTATVYYQVPRLPGSSFAVVVRSTLPLGALARAARQVIAELDPSLARPEVRMLQSSIDDSLSSRRLALLVLGMFGAFATLLTVVGVFGVLTYATTQRRHEFAIRAALGASSGHILTGVITAGLRLTGVGALLGILASFWASKLLARTVYGIPVHDPLTFSGVVLLVLGCATGACLLPAYRASRIDSALVMRE
jgi:putative ABC transport system permease protein